MSIELPSDELKEMLEENLRLTREIHEMTKKIKGYITFQKVMSFVYLLLIVAPIIVSIIYLPPLIQGMIGQYQGLLGGAPGAQLDVNSLLQNLNPSAVKSLPPEAQKLLQPKK